MAMLVPLAALVAQSVLLIVAYAATAPPRMPPAELSVLVVAMPAAPKSRVP